MLQATHIVDSALVTTMRMSFDDNGGEFISTGFIRILTINGVKDIVINPQANAICEQMH
jgi:transposase InsO family protein